VRSCSFHPAAVVIDEKFTREVPPVFNKALIRIYLERGCLLHGWTDYFKNILQRLLSLVKDEVPEALELEEALWSFTLKRYAESVQEDGTADRPLWQWMDYIVDLKESGGVLPNRWDKRIRTGVEKCAPWWDILIEAYYYPGATFSSELDERVDSIPGEKLITHFQEHALVPGRGDMVKYIMRRSRLELHRQLHKFLKKEHVEATTIQKVIENLGEAHPYRDNLVISMSATGIPKEVAAKTADKCEDPYLPKLFKWSLHKWTKITESFWDNTDWKTPLQYLLENSYPNQTAIWARALTECLKGYRELEPEWFRGICYGLITLRESLGRGLPTLLGKIKNDKKIPAELREVAAQTRKWFSGERSRWKPARPERRVSEAREKLRNSHDRILKRRSRSRS